MNIQCPICLIDKDLCITNCNHGFCIDCLKTWLSIKHNCPNCRNNIESFKYKDEIHRVVYINDIGDLNINRGELSAILRNSEQYRILNNKILMLLSAMSFTSILFISSSAYLFLNCNI